MGKTSRRSGFTAFFISIILCVTAVEVFLRLFYGFGDPVLYDSSPVYGYRPLPNQVIRRFHGSDIKINNLGLRADADWDSKREKKVLFLGDSITYGGSYIGNGELFSQLAVDKMPGHKSGNAGVNAWGVENVYGLIVEKGFLPAEVYVSVFPEGDFYRGLTRLQGLPFFNRKPKCALQELILFYLYRANLTRYIEWTVFASKSDIEFVVGKAVVKLKGMDEFIKSQGFRHIIFITPYRTQVFHGDKKDPIVEKMLQKYGVNVIYINDRIDRKSLPAEGLVFHDASHLEKKGHEIWGRIIGDELLRVI